MEKEGIFYKRESLDPKDVVTLIRLWELDAGESFDDYCNFPQEADRKFYKFLECRYPILYEYVLNVIQLDDWKSCDISSIFNSCVDYCTQWIPDYNIDLWNEQYTVAYYPLAEFILEDDIAWENFVMFFTDIDNTSSNTPWIDCYNIRKDFENR